MSAKGQERTISIYDRLPKITTQNRTNIFSSPSCGTAQRAQLHPLAKVLPPCHAKSVQQHIHWATYRATPSATFYTERFEWHGDWPPEPSPPLAVIDDKLDLSGRSAY